MLTLIIGAPPSPSYGGRSKDALCPRFSRASFNGGRDLGLAQRTVTYCLNLTQKKLVPPGPARDAAAQPGRPRVGPQRQSRHPASGKSLESVRPLPILCEFCALAPRILARGVIGTYRLTISPLAPLLGLDCRHLPSARTMHGEAIGRFGLWAGGWMALARLCRCHPLGTSGLDFVPRSLPQMCALVPALALRAVAGHRKDPVIEMSGAMPDASAARVADARPACQDAGASYNSRRHPPS